MLPIHHQTHTMHTFPLPNIHTVPAPGVVTVNSIHPTHTSPHLTTPHHTNTHTNTNTPQPWRQRQRLNHTSIFHRALPTTPHPLKTLHNIQVIQIGFKKLFTAPGIEPDLETPVNSKNIWKILQSPHCTAQLKLNRAIKFPQQIPFWFARTQSALGKGWVGWQGYCF